MAAILDAPWGLKPLQFSSEKYNGSVLRQSMGHEEQQTNYLPLLHKAMDTDSNYEHSERKMLQSWIRKHPEHWEVSEVLDWIYYVVDQECLDGSLVRGEAFRTVRGNDLCLWSKDDFLKAEPNFGETLYVVFRKLINDISFLEPKESCRNGFHDENSISNITLENYSYYNYSNCASLNRNIHQNLTSYTNISLSIAKNTRRGSIEGDRVRKVESMNTNTSNEIIKNSNSSIVVYKTDTDVKVDLNNLGIYSIPIGTDFDLDLPTALLSPTTPSSTFSPQWTTSSWGTQAPIPTAALYASSTARLDKALSFSSPFCHDSTPQVLPTHNSRPLGEESYPLSPESSPPRCSSVSSTIVSPQFPSPTSTPYKKSISHSVSLSSLLKSDPHDSDYVSDDAISFISSYGSECQIPSLKNGSKMQQDPDSDVTYGEYKPTSESKKSRKGKSSSSNSKGNHLWEFIKDLLRNPKTNPKLIKWEDKENGVFRFVQSESIANLWGEKKNNPVMTYEKLSRAMRFCRTAGYFESVPKTGKFPKKLCFMFGSKAHGWRE